MIDNTLDEKTPFPATPQEMHAMLAMEAVAKRQGRLTEAGMHGYLHAKTIKGHEVPGSMRAMMKLGPNGEVLFKVREDK